jgi:threonine synthase
MRWACQETGQVIDPHTAIGLAAARIADLPSDVPVVTLATAHPAKFRDAVERATGQRPPIPARIGGLFEREERYATLPATIEAIEGFVSERAMTAA